MNLQPAEYFDTIIEKPLQSHDWPYNRETNRKTSSKQIKEPNVLYSLKDAIELVQQPVFRMNIFRSQVIG